MIVKKIILNRILLLTGWLTMVASTVMPLPSAHGEGGARRDVVRQSTEQARGEAAAPSSLTKNATIIDWNRKELRKGSNGWTCLPDNPTTPDTDPQCMNESWLTFQEALKSNQKPTITQVGIAYMLQGGAPASNTDPYAKTPLSGDDWVEGLGAHIMIVVPDVKSLQHISTDSKNGGPWVMWANTPYAHLMLPVQSYPSQ